jgi:GNAT superfamily N-acetyltransferase
MSFEIRRFPEPGSFLIRAEPWLLGREAENNLVVGIAYSLAAGADWFEPPLYLATVESAGSVVGVAYRTPPHKLGVSRMPLAAVPALVADAAMVYDGLPAVLGPEAVAARFGELWASERGCRARPGMAQRIYSLTRVTPPRDPPPGAMRPALPDEAELLVRWAEGFGSDTGIGLGDTARRIADLIEHGQLFVWTDGGPVSMAAGVGDTPNGARVGYVYTPPDERGRGYASALTAAVSQTVLDRGKDFCCLYTDRSAATPNHIYQEIGYRPVCDVMDVEFV